MSYAIMRFEKRKSAAIGGLNRHHERQKKRYDSNPDIDHQRTNQNYHIIQPRAKYRDEIFNRIQSAGCKVRKDSVLFIDTLITASPEFFEKHSPEESRAYFERAVDFLEREIGEENIVSAVVHLDERTPHMHICFVPITQDKRLSAKDIIGNRNKLVWWQDQFYEHMSAAFSELERGEPAAETKRKHMPVRIYKQAVRLSEEAVVFKQELEGIKPLNAQKKKKELLERLVKWIPRVNSFEAQLQPFKNQLDVMKYNQQAVQEKYDRASVRLSQSEYTQIKLREQLGEYEEFIASIPDDLREALMEKFRQEQDYESEQRMELRM